jgi:hypothetical protein
MADSIKGSYVVSLHSNIFFSPESNKGSEHSETHVQSLHSITVIKCVFLISHA